MQRTVIDHDTGAFVFDEGLKGFANDETVFFNEIFDRARSAENNHVRKYLIALIRFT